MESRVAVHTSICERERFDLTEVGIYCKTQFRNRVDDSSSVRI